MALQYCYCMLFVSFLYTKDNTELNCFQWLFFPQVLALPPMIYVPEQFCNKQSLGVCLWEATSSSHMNKIYFYALNDIRKGKQATVEEYTGWGEHQIYSI